MVEILLFGAFRIKLYPHEQRGAREDSLSIVRPILSSLSHGDTNQCRYYKNSIPSTKLYPNSIPDTIWVEILYPKIAKLP